MSVWMTLALAAALFVGNELWVWVEAWRREVRGGGDPSGSSSLPALRLAATESGTDHSSEPGRPPGRP
jgi:hypothetical protein